MNEDTDSQDGPATEPVRRAEAEGPLAGERLAQARREQRITVLEVAKELHLDEPKVRALERNDFEVLGAPVFAKGHLRKYASLVDVSIEDVLADYYMLNRSAGMPPVVGKVRKPAREFSPGPWIAAFVLIVIAVAAYWWFIVRDPAVVPDPFSSSPVPQDTDVGVFDDSQLADASDLAPASVITSAPDPDSTEPPPDSDLESMQASTESAVGTSPVPEPQLAAGDVQITLAYADDCWTEIVDASGRRLLYTMGRDGMVRSVTGQAPLSVLIGNADAVSLLVNGVDYSINAADRRGAMARLTVMSPR